MARNCSQELCRNDCFDKRSVVRDLFLQSESRAEVVKAKASDLIAREPTRTPPIEDNGAQSICIGVGREKQVSGSSGELLCPDTEGRFFFGIGRGRRMKLGIGVSLRRY